eukprot:TRINITY_DN2331_c1_g1_i1.p2 TRINITY_DN2331_c1_g1~~TRINITY_DN2331_c1_g1_i1.p2  ORF type:complete len:582 (+),score=47.92 TRINITY_DN2331_c1_g1_i1:8693-10438(+)
MHFHLIGHFANKRQSVSDVTSPLMSKDFTSLVNKKEQLLEGVKIFRIEIAKLRGKNNELIMQLKRLNEELDQKVGNARLGANKAKSENPEAQETKIVNEIECLGKMCKLYETELEQLRAKAKVRADTETVVEMEKKIVVENEKQNALQKKIRKLQKKVKDGEKSIERSVKRFEDGIPQLEVTFQRYCHLQQEDKLLVLFNRELQKTEDLERKLKQQADVVVTKDIKCDELREKAQGLESEIEELKRLAKMVAPQNESENTTKNCSIEELREKVKQAKTELEVETAKNAKELKAQQEILTMLHDKYHDLEQVRRIFLKSIAKQDKCAQVIGADQNQQTNQEKVNGFASAKENFARNKEGRDNFTDCQNEKIQEEDQADEKSGKPYMQIKILVPRRLADGDKTERKSRAAQQSTQTIQGIGRELQNQTTEKAGRNKIPSNTKSQSLLSLLFVVLLIIFCYYQSHYHSECKKRNESIIGTLINTYCLNNNLYWEQLVSVILIAMLLMKHEKEREEKQIYLRDSVVNAGLNADKFVEYLQSIRGILFLLSTFKYRKWSRHRCMGVGRTQRTSRKIQGTQCSSHNS